MVVHNEMKQFVDSKTCLECRGCCNFVDEHWLPVLLSAETVLLHRNEISGIRHNGRIACEFLDTAAHTCTIYGRRPFECALYPFMLVKRGCALDLAAHLACPFVVRTMHTEAWEAYTWYLAGLLKMPKWIALLKKEISRFRTYPAEEFLTIRRNVLGSRG
jgi:Fe-S-cluster containining protein